MKFIKSTKNKTKAQAMVEFAIALPVLLVLLYGIVEVGRFLFMYSTVVTASRQASRYGTATGQGLTTLPRYNDCQGIRDAANKAGYLGKFDTIEIEYDGGPGQPLSSGYCSGANPTDSSLTSTMLQDNKHRIVVKVTTQFNLLVPLVPLRSRPITATSARTIIERVAVVIDTPTPIKDPTKTEITFDLPDPSEIDQDVTVTVHVTNTKNAAKIPTGTVLVADKVDSSISCIATLLANGTGNCIIRYPTIGAKTITAKYSGDAQHDVSNALDVAHTVNLITTATNITSDTPDPSLPNQTVTVFVNVINVNGVITKATGTVDVDGGENNNKCTVTLVDGAGSCQITYKKTGVYTITAVYGGDSKHKPSSNLVGETHNVMINTPTPTLSPVPTVITNTPAPTLTPIPPTALASCVVTRGLLQLSSNTLFMTLNNQTGTKLEVSTVTLWWNSDKGHDIGNKKLVLLSASLSGTTFFTGSDKGPKTIPPIVPSPAVSIPTGTSTIVFTFDQTYDLWDDTELIEIRLLNPGCLPITQTQH